MRTRAPGAQLYAWVRTTGGLRGNFLPTGEADRRAARPTGLLVVVSVCARWLLIGPFTDLFLQHKATRPRVYDLHFPAKGVRTLLPEL